MPFSTKPGNSILMRCFRWIQVGVEGDAVERGRRTRTSTKLLVVSQVNNESLHWFNYVDEIIYLYDTTRSHVAGRGGIEGIDLK